jgi:NhaP-type Na+/H+ and K+/H+ antiporter
VLGRAAFVLPLSALSNYCTKSPNTKISPHHQVVIWWAGLMRGAVSIALAFNQFTEGGRTRNSDEATVITTTITVVLFSTIVSSSNPLKIKNHFCSFKSCLSSGIPGSFSIYQLCNNTFLLPAKS